MNRESHLRRSLPQWLTIPGIDEIVVVDWSTAEDISALLQLDPRIRIVRAEGERRWVLSYAYNLGIAQARGDVILKCDADCVPSASIIQFMPAPGHFYAGNWTVGRNTGKSCVNGQCIFFRAHWEQVNGYSEVLRRYGHDDTDFYDRLTKAGIERRSIQPEQVEFLEHSVADRVVNQNDSQKTSAAEAYLHGLPGFHESINILISSFIPWGKWFTRAVFEKVSGDDRRMVVSRDNRLEIPIAPPLQQLAYSVAMRAHVGRICKLPPQRLNRLSDEGCIGELARFVGGLPVPPVIQQPAA